MTQRYQKGQLVKKHGAWHVRWYGRAEVDGEPVWREKQKLLGRIEDYPRERDINPVFDDFMAEINAMYCGSPTTMSLAHFIEYTYLTSDEVVKGLARSTVDGYGDIFKVHLKDQLQKETLGTFTTPAARTMLQKLATDKSLRKRTIANIKHFLSGVYTFALNSGYFSGSNPITAVKLRKLKVPRRDSDTFAYSLAVTRAMMSVVTLKPRTAMAIAGYAGLTKSEIQGLRWEDRQGNELVVARSVWEGINKVTKTEHRAAPVPIISELAKVLDEYWDSLGRPAEGWVFPAARGTAPLRLSNLQRREIAPALKRHKLSWHGWHAFRRGLATNLSELGVGDGIIQRILRHGSAETTRKHYIKRLPPSVKKAMMKLDRRLKRDKNGTV